MIPAFFLFKFFQTLLKFTIIFSQKPGRGRSLERARREEKKESSDRRVNPNNRSFLKLKYTKVDFDISNTLLSLAKLISRLARDGEDLERERGEKKIVGRTREEDQCKSVTNPSQVPGMVIRTTLYTSHCTAICKALYNLQCTLQSTCHCTLHHY